LPVLPGLLYPGLRFALLPRFTPEIGNQTSVIGYKELTLLTLNLLLAGDSAATGTLTGARIGMRALAANRQVATMANAAIRLDFDEAADIHLDLFAEIAFDAAFLLNDRADAVHLVLGEVANLLRKIDIGLFGDILRALLPDPWSSDVCSSDLSAFAAEDQHQRYVPFFTSPLLNSLEPD